MARGRGRGSRFQAGWWLLSVVGALIALALIVANAPKSTKVAVQSPPTTLSDPIADATPTTVPPPVTRHLGPPVTSYSPTSVQLPKHRAKPGTGTAGAATASPAATTPPGATSPTPGGVQSAAATPATTPPTVPVTVPALIQFVPNAHLPVTE